jgi:ketosteroid isomerase-like protein
VKEVGTIAYQPVSINKQGCGGFMVTRSSWFLMVFLFVSVGAALAPAQAAPSEGKPEDQVAQLERDWLLADGKGDADRLRQIIADNFIGSSPVGSLLNKDDIIPEGTAPGGFAGATPSDTSIRVFGDTGVLMGVINVPAKPQPKQIRVTLVCQKSAQGWQIIAAQLTPL